MRRGRNWLARALRWLRARLREERRGQRRQAPDGFAEPLPAGHPERLQLAGNASLCYRCTPAGPDAGRVHLCLGVLAAADWWCVPLTYRGMTMSEN